MQFPLLKNPLQQADAVAILGMTKPERRWKTLMAYAGETTQAFANALDIDKVSLYRWFIGRQHMPLDETVDKIADALGVTSNIVLQFLSKEATQ